MTIFTPLTAATNAERLEVSHDTAYSIAFAAVLPCLADFIEAERDQADICHSYDPAYSAWHRDAQRARGRLDSALRHVHSLRVERPEDRPLRRMVVLADAMLKTDVPDRPRYLHRQMRLVFFRQFQVQGFGPTAHSRNALLIQARHLIDAMMRLPLFDYSPDCTIAPDATAPADDLSPAFF
ncbi:MAG: hypothetical protein KBT70_05445 [Roseovarius sp.]|uniref:hypothetical protein n=1 Tax=Roseovarius sp. TaxID=1486281 RepID=UPI001B6A51A8|nr:hypothetical protein [Roseovarius sp.]MBQ0749627.1 hypothetical protein [Roseovarius sp.]MBQ0808755.1 hypothetical protein [Roseovarius sp.]